MTEIEATIYAAKIGAILGILGAAIGAILGAVGTYFITIHLEDRKAKQLAGIEKGQMVSGLEM